MEMGIVYTCNVQEDDEGRGGRKDESDAIILHDKQNHRRLSLSTRVCTRQRVELKKYEYVYKLENTHAHMTRHTTHPRIISPFDETGIHLRYILVHVIRVRTRTIVIIRVVPGTTDY